MKSKQNKAFTLAEVLITLGIIGIIAEITIPTLMQNIQESVTITSLKKAYSTFSQAFTSAIQQNGTVDQWNLSNSVDILDKIYPYLRLTKICRLGESPCFPQQTKYKDGSWANYSNTNWPKGILSDGMNFYLILYNTSCKISYGNNSYLQNICAELSVDINGAKPPNAWGKDHFLFWVTKYGIIPAGTPLETTGYNFSEHCIANDGYGCTAWVLYNENLDYWHCSDLSWNGKHKCSP